MSSFNVMDCRSSLRDNFTKLIKLFWVCRTALNVWDIIARRMWAKVYITGMEALS